MSVGTARPEGQAEIDLAGQVYCAHQKGEKLEQILQVCRFGLGRSDTVEPFLQGKHFPAGPRLAIKSAIFSDLINFDRIACVLARIPPAKAWARM